MRVDRLLRVGGLVAAALTVLLTVGSLVLLAAGARVPWVRGPAVVDFLVLMAPLVWGAAGVLLVARLPGNPMGWILLGVAVTFALDQAATGAITYTHVVENRPTPVTEVLAAVGDALIFGGVALGFVVLLLAYPDGRLPGPRWRWVLWTIAGIWVAYGTVTLFGRAPLYALPSVDNPLGWFGDPELFDLVQIGAFLMLSVVGLPVGIAAVVVRWRRGDAIQRQQIKWLLWAGALLLIATAWALAETMIRGLRQAGMEAPSVVSVAVPVAILAAITRYRLYEIDRLISRTVTYAVVAVGLAGTYTVGALTLGAVVGRDDSVAVAGATLAAALLFNPLRRKAQSWVDRHFNRDRYDASREVERFSRRLSDTTALDAVTDELVRLATRTMQPATVHVWIRDEKMNRPGGSDHPTPETGTGPEAGRMSGS